MSNRMKAQAIKDLHYWYFFEIALDLKLVKPRKSFQISLVV